MGASSYTKLKVGFTTMLALVILFGGLLWVKNYNPAKKKVRMTVVFADGRGITGGDPVHMSGVKIGEVTGVNLSVDNRALINFYMDYARLSPETRFTIQDVGLMGDKALVIIPGESPGELDFGVIHEGVMSDDLSTLIASADKILKRLDAVTTKIEHGVDVEKLTHDFLLTMEKFREAAFMYEKVASENREPLKKTLMNMQTTVGEVKNFIETHDEKFGRAVESFTQTSDKISVFLDNMNKISSVIDTVAVYMDSGEGTFVKLMKYDELYEELRQTNAAIDSFITDFKRNPGKYTKEMKFKIRLF